MRRSDWWTGLGVTLACGLGLWACSSTPSTGATSATSSGSTSASSSSSTGATTTTTTGAGGGSSSSTTGTGGAVNTCSGYTAVATLPIGSAPYGLFVDADNVYWTNSGTGEVMQAKKDGTAPITLASGQGVPYCVVVHAGFVYWVSYDIEGVMRKAPVGGGTLVDIVSAPAARELVVAGDSVFWSREPDDIEKVPEAGLPDGGATTLLSMNPLSNGITADQEQVYWVNRQDGYVKKADFMLGNETVLGIGDIPWDIAVDDTFIYWTERGSMENVGKVSLAKKSDGTGLVVLATDQNGPRGIAADKTHVYWTNQEEGTVRRVPVGGGDSEIVACEQEKPVNVAVDDTFVYWTTLAGDTVMKVAKK